MGESTITKLKTASKTNPFIWTISNIRLPKNMEWDFSLRKWQIPILNDITSRNIVVMKPAQVGMSTVFLCKMFYTAIHEAIRAAYVLPRDKDCSDMVSTRADPIINNSPELSNRMTGVDSVRRKIIGDSFLHFLEASTEPRMLDIDMLVVDEIDLADQTNLDAYQARLYASKYKIHYGMSTPTIPNFGIDDLVQKSTWNIWNVKCPYCGDWIQFDHNWLSILKIRKHRIYYGGNCCDSCKDIGLSPEVIANGIWVPQFPSRLITGYQVVRTMDATTSATELHTSWKKTRVERHFYNFSLGIPYVAGGVTLEKDDIINGCLDGSLHRQTHGSKSDRYFIGIDQGNILHLVVIKVTEDDVMQVVYADILDQRNGDPFAQAQRIIRNYPNSFTVIDRHPNKHDAVRFARDNKNTWSCYFRPSARSNKTEIFEFDKEENGIIIEKHDALDELVSAYITNDKFRLYSSDGFPDTYTYAVAEHLGAMQRTIQTKRIVGMGERQLTVWESTGPDHFTMALLYAMIAYKASQERRAKGFKWRIL